MRSVLTKAWDLMLAAVATVAAALWLEASIIKDVATEAITFLGLQSAVIIPTMIFTAGIMRAEGLTLQDAERYQSALRKQMHFWVGLLILDFLAVCILIVGKAAAWKVKVAIGAYRDDLGWILIALAVFLVTLAILRLIPFVKGVISLLELNGELTRKRIIQRDEELAREGTPPSAPVAPFQSPDGYGRTVGAGKNRKRA